MARIETRNVGVRIPVGMIKEIDEILQKDQTYLSVQEFIRMATKKLLILEKGSRGGIS